MHLSLLHGGDLHVVAILVGEILMGVAWGGECLALKLDGGEGEDGVAAVIHAATIVDGDIGEMVALSTHEIGYAPEIPARR